MAGLPERMRATVRSRLSATPTRRSALRDRRAPPPRGAGRRRHAATSTTSGPGSARCRRRPPSTAATPWCAARTAPSCATPADAIGALRIRVAGGEFDAAVRSVAGWSRPRSEPTLRAGARRAARDRREAGVRRPVARGVARAVGARRAARRHLPALARRRAAALDDARSPSRRPRRLEPVTLRAADGPHGAGRARGRTARRPRPACSIAPISPAPDRRLVQHQRGEHRRGSGSSRVSTPATSGDGGAQAAVEQPVGDDGRYDADVDAASRTRRRRAATTGRTRSANGNSTTAPIALVSPVRSSGSPSAGEPLVEHGRRA